jgi:hypothetical protein
MTRHQDLTKPQDSPFMPAVRRQTFAPTDAAAGSPEKVEILRERAELGLPLTQEFDRRSFIGLTGAVRPRLNDKQIHYEYSKRSTAGRLDNRAR